MTGNSCAIVGNGGREYEIGRSIAQTSETTQIRFLPGNGGTESLPNSENVPINPASPYEVLGYVVDEDIDLTIIGSENHIVTGTPDMLRRNNRLVFGPSVAAAQLEASKSRAVEFMNRYGIPHPDTVIVDDVDASDDYIDSHEPGTYVLKADGLCAGKGVDTFDIGDDESTEDLRERARIKAYAMLSGEMFGEAGKRVLFQEMEYGPEVSVVVFFDGTNSVMLPISQDHKRLREGDSGAMTGGTGAFAPVPRTIISEGLEKRIAETIIERSIGGLQEEARRSKRFVYRGALYAGLILTSEGPKVLEYNVRLGDPESQVQLPLMAADEVDLWELFYSTADGSLDPSKYHKSYGDLGLCALSIVLSAPGYPINPQPGSVIHGLDRDYTGVIIQQAGTRLDERRNIIASGGRVLAVTGLGADFNSAADYAEAAIGEEHEGVYFEGMQWRNDIGWRVRR